MHGMVYEYVCVCMCVWSGHSLEGRTMAFLCSELQVAVETQSQTKPCWHTECRECRMLLPPSGDAGQNRAIVPDRLWAINAPQPPSVTNTYAQKYQYTLTEWIMEIFTYNFYFQMNMQSRKGKVYLFLTMIKNRKDENILVSFYIIGSFVKIKLITFQSKILSWLFPPVLPLYSGNTHNLTTYPLHKLKPQWHTWHTHFTLHVDGYHWCHAFGSRNLFHPNPNTCFSLNQSRRSAKTFPICKNIKSALTNMEAVGHMHKSSRHICWHLEHTVNTHRAGNASCRLHGLEMRNMIHFLSMLDSHALTALSSDPPVQINSSELRSWTWQIEPRSGKMYVLSQNLQDACTVFEVSYTTIFYSTHLHGWVCEYFM